MKKLVCLMLVALSSCESRRETKEAFPPAEVDDAWITYEGKVPLDPEAYLYIQLSMMPTNQAGEGIFQMQEFIQTDTTIADAASFNGKYSTLYGETPDVRIIQLHNSAHERSLKRTYTTSGFRGNITDSHLAMIRQEPFRATDLVLKTSGKNKLLVLDDNMQIISQETEHNLVRRNTRPFTMEGYFRHNGDTADFFEVNTEEKWAVSKYGDYANAIRQYHLLTSRKFEVTYMKGIGFSIRHVNKEGKEIDALVIKKVLQMTSQ